MLSCANPVSAITYNKTAEHSLQGFDGVLRDSLRLDLSLNWDFVIVVNKS